MNKPFILFAFFIFGLSGCQQSLVRGPYLQNLGSDQVTIRWRTQHEGPRNLLFAKSGSKKLQKLSSASKSIEHEVHLHGLLPDTKYEYMITEDEAISTLSEQKFSFRTAPRADTKRRIRVWVLGDPGTGDENQKNVRDAYLELEGSEQTDLILALGDNAYDAGTDDEFQTNFFEIYQNSFVSIPVFPAFGNNDGESADSSSQSGVYYDIFTLPTQGELGGVPSGTEAYYSFDYGSIHFICLDTAESDLHPEAAMATWLKEDLRSVRSKQPWIIVFAHHAPYSHGTYNTDIVDPKAGRIGIEVRENIVPILEKGNVDLFITGHSHVYERSYLLKGHYGVSQDLAESMVLDRHKSFYKKDLNADSAQGTIYVVSGSAGKTKPAPLDHPAMAFSSNDLGSLWFEVEGLELRGFFTTAEGDTPDQFTIQKV